MLSIIIAGALGRMGKAIRDIAKNENDIKIGSLIEREDHPMIGEFFDDLKLESSLGDIIDKGDVVIDFTTPSASLEHLKIVAKYKKAIIIGTTGFSDNQKDEIKRFSKDAKVVLSPNMSVGINLLSHIIGLVTEVLGADFDTEIVEFHHHFKKDAPSGTALMLAEVIAKVRGYKLDKDLIFGRYGNVGARPQDQIGIHAVRAGDIVGEHLAHMTRATRLSNGTLTVEVSSPIVSQELNLLKENYIALLNERMGRVIVQRIRFVPGKFPRPRIPLVSAEDNLPVDDLFLTDIDDAHLRDSFNSLYKTQRRRETAMLKAGAHRCERCGVVFFGNDKICPGCQFDEIADKQ